MNPSIFQTPLRIIDLTHPLCDAQSVFPGDPPVCFHECANVQRDGYRVTQVSLGSHGGTHVDAASHFLPQGQSIDQLPLETLVGPALVVDIPGQPGAMIGPELLQAHQETFRQGARVLFRTGWEIHYGTDQYWHDYPSMTPEAAQWIVNRGVALVGFDTPGPAKDAAEVHKLLLGAVPPVVIVESLVNLGNLPADFLLVVAPLKLAGLDGAPARVFALV